MFQQKWLGRTSYADALDEQDKQFQKIRKQGTGGVILGQVHPLTITLGRRAKVEEDIFDSSGADIFHVDRGGQATLHAEGQLVIYPVVNLKNYKIGISDFVTLIAETTQIVLKTYQIDSRWDACRPGLYTDRGKIGFVGIRVTDGVSRHGLALNVQNNLQEFSRIRSCGVANETFDRMADWKKNLPDMPEIFELWAQTFEQKMLIKVANIELH